jgi:hypothetical protein
MVLGMTRRASPLPDSLPDVFTLGDADVRGVTRSRLRAADLLTPTSGLRRRAGTQGGVVQRARDFTLALPPHMAFSHHTAARLLDLPLPRPWQPSEPVDVMRVTGTGYLERRGVRSHRGLDRRTTTTAHGLRVTSLVDTWADLAPHLDLGELVAIGDVLLDRPGPITADLLRAEAHGRHGRGCRRLREAAALLRIGAASPWESRARVAFAGWGLPEPDLNVDLYDAYGRWLARPDFVWREKRVVGEYDGDQHRTDRRAWQYERERRAGLEDEGWTYVEMTSLSLTAARESAALRRRLTRLLL